MIKREIKSNPVPKNLFKKTMADIERDKEERRKQKVEAVRQTYEAGDKQRFKLQVEERPKKFDQIKEKYLKEKEDELQFDKKHFRKMPDFDKNEAVVKLTAASVYREGH